MYVALFPLGCDARAVSYFDNALQTKDLFAIGWSFRVGNVDLGVLVDGLISVNVIGIEHNITFVI